MSFLPCSRTIGVVCNVAALMTAGICAAQQASVGGGSIDQPAEGPSPAYAYDLDTGFVLVKNWDFGLDGTIRSIDDLSRHFQYHDQFGTICNGGDKYGALIVAPDEANALKSKDQPIQGVNTDRSVRNFNEQCLQTFLVPLDGADRVHPTQQKAGSGSFQAKWTLPAGGSRLGLDILWETRVRYETPPYFWFAIWTAGNKWDKGAEIDLIESFGWDNTDKGGGTNFDGRFWHSSVVGGESETDYHKNWGAGMANYGIDTYDATQWHVWTMLYRADDTFTFYVDGKPVQRGKVAWTFGATNEGEPIDMSFIFDGTWGHKSIGTVNRWLDGAELKDAVYEWDYSRIYLRKP